uniref:ATP-dependent DNA helicase n=1 Tax=Blastobotrys adeninivorans TaxID=409370 RepID=A0A060T8R3_BLAAD
MSDSDDFSEGELLEIERRMAEKGPEKSQPAQLPPYLPPPSSPQVSRPSSQPRTVQTTLTGGIARAPKQSLARRPNSSPGLAGASSSPRSSPRGIGSSPVPSPASRSSSASNGGSQNISSISANKYPPTHHELDLDNCKTIIYPINLSEREYQLNIVRHALFQNVLCALPTGLGKTFIASTVMLNWYRWTKTAKIIFLAPTRPLVSQQVEACLGITGIPRHDVSVMVGNLLAPSTRAVEWESKRVIFATPQTVDNDLKKGLVDPRTIACLVIDEAHHAKGKASYVEVAKAISKLNQSFRILAITATPSGNLEGVQEVITNLSISRAEIRTEESIDVARYVHKRNIEKITVAFSPEQEEILELFGQAIEPMFKELKDKKLIFISSAWDITQFGVHQSMTRFSKSELARSGNWGVISRIRGIFVILMKAGHALRLLKIHGIRPFYHYLRAWQAKEMIDPKGKPRKKPKKLVGELLEHPSWDDCMKRCQELTNNPDFLGHGKLTELIDHLNSFLLEQEMASTSTRVIVFCEYRHSGLLILKAIERNCPRARPFLFVGQSGPRSGKKKKAGPEDDGVEDDEFDDGEVKGMTQKEQQRVVKDFKAGNINTLIATSIGEEGLDVGEVDFIICYDQSSSPIRGLQRMGRTGRKRKGKILMLMVDKEDSKLEYALNGYKYIQDQLNKNIRFEYAPVNRMLPPEIKPELCKTQVTIPEENNQVLKQVTENHDIVDEVTQLQRQQRGKRKRQPKAPAPKKRFFMPEGVETGFRTAQQVYHEEQSEPGQPAEHGPDNKSIQQVEQEQQHWQEFFESDAEKPASLTIEDNPSSPLDIPVSDIISDDDL